MYRFKIRLPNLRDTIETNGSTVLIADALEKSCRDRWLRKLSEELLVFDDNRKIVAPRLSSIKEYTGVSLREFDSRLRFRALEITCSKARFCETQSITAKPIGRLLIYCYDRDVAEVLDRYLGVKRIYIDDQYIGHRIGLDDVKVLIDFGDAVVDDIKSVVRVAAMTAAISSLATMVACADRIIEYVNPLIEFASENPRVLLFECWSSYCRERVEGLASSYGLSVYRVSGCSIVS